MEHNLSLAEQFLGEYQKDDDSFLWLIAYDFIEKKPPPKFWKNLEKMMSISTVSRIQYSVLIAENMRDALLAAQLVEHYNGLVEVFHGDRFRGW
ncbi:hypothetical protein KQH65_01880 [archaeon]|nr:hypothetical protein [archaeon]